MNRRWLSVSFAATLLMAPTAVAVWGGNGSLEPDTQRDLDDGLMWRDPDTTVGGARKVYFNGFAVFASPLDRGAHASHNLAARSTAVFPTPTGLYAMLGVWKDCNDDGYIGLGEQGVMEYRAELLLDPKTLKDPGICPAESVPKNIPHDWAPVHNDGTWVHEWIPIGWDTWRTTVASDGTVRVRQHDLNPWNFNDSSSRVWADWNLPEDPVDRLCYGTAMPRGGMSTAGQMLAWADCHANGRGRGTATMLAEAAGQRAAFDAGLERENPWGRGKDDAYVDAFDCESEDRVFEPRDPTYDPETKTGVTRPVVPDPTRGGAPWYPANFSDQNGFLGYDGPFGRVFLYRANISMVKAPNFHEGGSMAGTINETQTDTDDCDRTDSRQSSSGDSVYALERDVENIDGPRTRTDNVFRFLEGLREGGPHQQAGRTAPRDLGVRLTGMEGCLLLTMYPYPIDANGCNEGVWGSTSYTVFSRNPFVDRDSLQPEGVANVTYFAHVGAVAATRYGFELPGGPATSTLKYGAEHCFANNTREWDCDADAWWGGNSMPRDARLGFDPQTTHRPRHEWLAMPIGVKVGQGYQLRDIDCYDLSATPLRNEGVDWGVLTGTTCARSAS